MSTGSVKVRGRVGAGACALLLGMAAPLLAQSPRERLIVSASWLAEHRNDANLVLLHVGDRAEYDAEHIAGARYVSLQDISAPRVEGALALQMPPIEELRARLESLGISDDSRIVVYWGNDWVTPATRVVLTLDYAGLGERTSLLAGGMPQWKRDGHEVVSAVPAERRGRLSARPVRQGLIAPLSWVVEHAAQPKAGYHLVDARAAAFYDGTQEANGRKGHIPSAGSVPFNEVVDDALHWKSDAELRALFDAAGVKPGDVVVGYCHIGQQATAMLFAARLLGHEVRLFDGSMQEWAMDAARSVEAGR